ncbi:MAG: hypothetical protein WBP43_17945 [Chitinophagales bacterium]
MNFDRNLLVTAVMIAVTNLLSGQNYSISPADTIIGTVPYNDIYHFNIIQNNLTTDALIFSYEKVDAIYPIGWTANLCDNGTCYDGFPDSGTMDTVFNGDVGLMSVGINPGYISGTSLFRYIIWEESTPEILDTLTWIISTDGVSSVANALSASIDFIFNAQQKNVIITSNLNDGFEYFISDLSGRILINGKSFQPNVSIDVASFITGIYLVYILNNNSFSKGSQLLISN